MSRAIKFGKSVDGVERVTVRLDLRLSRDEVAAVFSQKSHGPQGLPELRNLLGSLIADEIDRLSERADGED